MANKNKEDLEEIEILDLLDDKDNNLKSEVKKETKKKKNIKSKKETKKVKEEIKKKTNKSKKTEKEITKKEELSKKKEQKQVKKKNELKKEKQKSDIKKIKKSDGEEPIIIKKTSKTKKRKVKKKAFIILIISIFLILFTASAFIIYFTKLDKDEPEIYEPIRISYKDYYFNQVKTNDEKVIYKLENNKFYEVGEVSKDIILCLESDKYLDFGFFKLKNSNYYIDYKNLEEDTTEIEVLNNTYQNYIPFNESIKTTDTTNFYLNDKLVYSYKIEMELPILIKEDNYYGVIFENKLLYVKKDECEVIKKQNTDLKHTSKIATLVYHFTYDSTNLEEKKKCLNSNVTICLSDTLFKAHLTYMKDNNFYTATMEDLSLFIDGKVQLPEKTVVITIDDGYFVSAAIKVLEELDLHATLFLIGKAGSPDDYKSDNLEIHSHTYGMHYAGACPGGQGSPLKCLNREKLLDDLKKSREQLNGSTVFCYPFFEYNDYAISVLKEAGFEMAFIGGRYKIKVGTNKYKIPRYGIINTTTVKDIAQIIN